MNKLKNLLYFFVFFFLVFYIAFNVAPFVRYFLLETGVIQEEILIAGTGSMYPTFPKGEGETDVIRAQEIVAFPKMRRVTPGINLFGFTFFKYNLSKGDIVELNNERTKNISQEKYGEEAGFVKRVIALPKDRIELRDGFVYINGKIIDEPYTAKPRSTYGGEFLSDCKVLEIPENKAFVLGDNRKASLDSRFDLELVDFSDIHYVIPFKEQEEYKKNWRDTKDDGLLAHTSTLNVLAFIDLLNVERKDSGKSSLKYNSLLSNSAKIRGFAMIKHDDFSLEASKSGVGLKDSFKQAGYWNVLSAEVFTRGFYEAEELLENFLEFPETKEILFSEDYQEIGIASVLGEIDKCPVQVIVAHFGGYVPPNYTTEEIESWKKLIEALENVIPSWQSLKDAEGIDKNELNQLISLLQKRLDNARQIYIRMKNNQWLTEAQQQMVSEDKSLGQRAEELTSKIMNE